MKKTKDLGFFDLSDYENLLQALKLTKDVEGSYVEIGVYKGRSAYLAMDFLRRLKSDKSTYLIDTYEGFTYPEAKDSQDALYLNTHNDCGLEQVNILLKDFDNCHLIKNNIIAEDLPSEINAISVCYIDVDIYEAVKASLFKACGKISKNGMIIVEDQGHTPALAGALLAVDEFLKSEQSKNFLPIHMSSGQLFLIRKD